MTLVGFTVDVNPANLQTAIGALWQKTSQSGLLQPGKPAYAAYYNYGDKGSTYTTLVGVELEAGSPIPEGCTELSVPAQSCLELSCKATVPDIQQAWGTVWSTVTEGRAWKVDLERWEGQMGTGTVRVQVGMNA